MRQSSRNVTAVFVTQWCHVVCTMQLVCKTDAPLMLTSWLSFVRRKILEYMLYKVSANDVRECPAL